eukprot:5250313-Karenia_brevis.AAC.1
MSWRFTKPWLETCDGESYNLAKPNEFTIVLVPYAVNDMDLCYAVTRVNRGGRLTHVFPAVANVDPQTLGISISRRTPSTEARKAINHSVMANFGAWFGRPGTVVEDILYNMYDRRPRNVVEDTEVVSVQRY